MKISYKSKIKRNESPWVYEFCFDVTYKDGTKTRIFTGISGDDLYEYLGYSQENGELTEQQLNRWRDSVIKEYMSKTKECSSRVDFHAYKNNQYILDYLRSSLK